MPYQTRYRSTRKLSRTLIALAAISTFSTSAGAGSVYKWVDGEGNVHYGDKAPSGANRQRIELQQSPPVDTSIVSRHSRTQRLLNSFAQEREEKKADRHAATNEKKKRKAQCAEAKKTQETYKNSAFLYTKSDNGERVILDDAGHDEAMARAQAEVDKWCG